MEKNFDEFAKMLYGDDLNETELQILRLATKANEYCKKDNASYEFILKMLVAVIKSEPMMISFMSHIIGMLNLAYVSGIERGKKMSVMEAFVSAESEEK